MDPGAAAGLAAQGKTVLVSSHLMSEIAQTADHLIVIGQGRLLADTTVAGLSAGHESLENAYVSLTDDTVEYRAAVGTARPRPTTGGAMTSISTTSTGTTSRGPGRVPAYALPQRVSQGRVIRAEWTKLRTQPSALWAGAASVGLRPGSASCTACCARPGRRTARRRWPRSTRPRSACPAIQLAQIAVGVLGAMLITSEYSSGMIRSTFAAVPRRLPVLWGKAAVALAAVFAASVPAVLVAFFAGSRSWPRWAWTPPSASPGWPGRCWEARSTWPWPPCWAWAWARCCATPRPR